VREGLERFPASEPFDCVTMWHSFEHMPDPLATVSAISGLLKPGGKLIVAVPDAGGLQATIFRHRWFHLDVPRHLHHFGAESLRYCLASAGYSIDRRWHQEFEYDLSGWVQSALNCVLPTPNVLFHLLTGRRREYGAFALLGNILLGSILTILFLPAIPIGTAAGRGGTLIVRASRSV